MICAMMNLSLLDDSVSHLVCTPDSFNLRDTVSQKLDRLSPCRSVDTSVVCHLLVFPV
jgi:hypothetical protein